jgi:uncharacterized protein with PIN domain
MSVSILQSAYERAFRSLLWRRQREKSPSLQRRVERLLQRVAVELASGKSEHEAFQRVYSAARSRTIRYLLRRRESQRIVRSGGTPASSRAQQQIMTALEDGIVREPGFDGADFHCDCGLGGLARWLRAAGYDARFWPSIADSDLVTETIHSSAVLLTTDEPLMKRAAVTWGVVPALLVPLDVGKHRQFAFVSQRLSLPHRSPKCMACGGSLTMVDKESVRERIPPRTFPWIDDYYECSRCRKLFWPGTHWQRVIQQLSSE